MSFFGRLVHMIGFEAIGIIVFTPITMFILNENILSMGILVVIISVTAMAWNFIYNYLFDLIEIYLGGHRSKRYFNIRMLHTILFEAGLLIITIPFIAYWLEISLMEALIVDIGFVIFYVFYALAYNYTFDKVYFGLTK
ncbi:PACE efflux transporter [Allofrancisella guangzhouensis]|uniref:LysR family transcriptional regulator n=1 Tax=Allofrancisella guangzhouensis TaxID=594679 RepID=A0A0A8E3V6_9GAMM|nr:PACE efflux transporter [Allofrancisella guangzhouensis]AJC48302.1 LysR family transcriptional regulator [Allofrancisella guangzhouensis]MBK2026612.1 PACE efflux transporter [Allofrancisella guangzhouensis]MBK2044356.1 PACE efflux transporter [Allofrancisella guangzhouensis]MBK2045599.1 PACE efflux transporter [Allofrancisella guangzhouensis]